MKKEIKQKIKDILTQKGYANIRFEGGILFATKPNSTDEIKITEAECLITFALVGK